MNRFCHRHFKYLPSEGGKDLYVGKGSNRRKVWICAECTKSEPNAKSRSRRAMTPNAIRYLGGLW